MENNQGQNMKIDVIIPVYNGASFIIKALASVEGQTTQPDKVIIINDGSTDNTAEVVNKYKENSKLRILLISKENGGLSSARNRGIKESTSEWLAFLDADDEWLPNKLEEQIKVERGTKLENPALIYCDYSVIDHASKIKYKNYKSPIDRKMSGIVFTKLLDRNRITASGSGVLIKKEVFSKVGLFDESLKFGEDWDMWLRISEFYNIDYSPKTLVLIRKNVGNMTSDSKKVFTGEIEFYNKWIKILKNKNIEVPIFWADKITFRILSRLPRIDFLRILKEKIPTDNYKQIFRYGLGYFPIYIPVFIIRRLFYIIKDPQYIKIIWGFIRHKGI
ncbi:MAG: glycosyltransferase [Candidatus Paceibacterota bacterium]